MATYWKRDRVSGCSRDSSDIVGAAVAIVRGSVQWLSESNAALTLEKGKVVIVGGVVEWRVEGCRRSRGKGWESKGVMKWDGYNRRWWLRIIAII